MKNLKLTLFFITGALFVSCDDAIDITQPSELPPGKVYETVTDMQLGLNGVYAQLPGENQIYFTSLFTDEVALGISNGGQGQDGELAFLLNPATSSDAANMWLENYAVINSANRLIYGLENVVIGTDDPNTVAVEDDETAWYNHILAQAHALRAYAYFNLLTYFSEDIKNNGSLGVMLLDFIPIDYHVQLPRVTTGEIFNFIDADLAFAAANLATGNPQPGGDEIAALDAPTYIRPEFITAFKARMAAYRGDYAAAKTFVDQLAAMPAYATLANKTEYKAIWSDTGVKEIIFKINRSNPGGNVTGNFYQVYSSVNSTVSGSPFFEVNRALFNLVNFSADVRQKIIVDPSAFPNFVLPNYATVSDYEYKTGDILPVGKYAKSESLNLLGDIKVFRMSEMYLIRAEYYASMGDNVNAIADVNRVRAARYGGASGNIQNASTLTAQQVWAFILRERRIELAFEGHRYVDIRRLGTLAGQGVDRDPRDCAFNGFCTLPATDYRFIMPIPRAETAANPNIQQNPNY